MLLSNCSRRQSVTALAASLVVSGFAGLARGQNTFIYGVGIGIDDVIDDMSIENENPAPINLAITNAPFGSASGTAFVGIGVNKAAGGLHLNSTAQSPVESAYAGSFSFWQDTLTISDPDLNGTPGTFTASMLVNGTGAVTAAGPWLNDEFLILNARWNATIAVSPDGWTFDEQGWEGTWENDHEGNLVQAGAPLGQVQPAVTFEFTFGEPFYMNGNLETDFGMYNFLHSAGTFDGELDLSNSAYWAGIQQIRNAGGQLVTGAIVTSASGMRWDVALDPRILKGDFDTNGIVNLSDFTILAAHFNTNVAPWNFGDATGDGRVNLADFNILAGNFNQPALSHEPTPDDWSALANVVPEPSTIGGALGMALLLGGARRRKA